METGPESEHTWLSRECPIVTPEVISIRGLIDAWETREKNLGKKLDTDGIAREDEDSS